MDSYALVRQSCDAGMKTERRRQSCPDQGGYHDTHMLGSGISAVVYGDRRQVICVRIAI